MKLKDFNPNHFYQNGRVKPSLLLYIILAYLAKAWLVVTGAIFIRGSATDAIINNLYPNHSIFIFHLATGVLPAVVFWLVSTQSEKAEKPRLQTLLRFSLYLLPILLIIDLVPVWFYIKNAFRPNFLLTGTVFFINFVLLFNLVFSPREKMYREQTKHVTDNNETNVDAAKESTKD